MKTNKINMKKTLVITAVSLILALSVTGCGCKKSSSNTSGSDNAYTQDVEQNYSKNVDMDKVDGQEAASETEESAYKGKVGDSQIVIEDAKIMEYEGDKVAVVSFSYTNKGSDAASFSSLFSVTAYQNMSELPSAVVVADGVEILSAEERVEKGKTITVQKVFKLRDDSALTVNVTEFNQNEDSTVLAKTFTF